MIGKSFKPNELNDELEEAAAVLDEERARELCERLTTHLKGRDDPYPKDAACTALGILRKKRYLHLMQAVADAFISCGQTAPKVRRLYAQSQLDLGNYTAAVCTLRRLEQDTAPGAEHTDPAEHAEALGLLGRAYKDLYVRSDGPRISRNRAYLEKAIQYYQAVYDADKKQKIWQGINGVALLQRAASDGVEIDGTDPSAKAKYVAGEILTVVEHRHQNQNADVWALGTALEASIALSADADGHLQESMDAIRWLQRYVQHPYADAFELGSTLRQMKQVWQLNPEQAPGDKILPLLEASLLQKAGSHVQADFGAKAHQRMAQLLGDAGYEKILGQDGFRSLKWLRTCMDRAAAVAKVEDAFEQAVGTAFAVRGSDLCPTLDDSIVFLTNAHVIAADGRALPADKARLKCELCVEGAAASFTVTQLWSSPRDKLDATLLQPSVPVDVTPVPLAGTLPLTDGQQRAYIIGHPSGRNLTVSIHDNHLLDYDDRLLHYRSPTEGGSSGSPVFSADWELIGVHHRGLRQMPRLHGDGTYPANEGVWIQAIRKGIAAAEVRNA